MGNKLVLTSRNFVKELSKTDLACPAKGVIIQLIKSRLGGSDAPVLTDACFKNFIIDLNGMGYDKDIEIDCFPMTIEHADGNLLLKKIPVINAK